MRLCISVTCAPSAVLIVLVITPDLATFSAEKSAEAEEATPNKNISFFIDTQGHGVLSMYFSKIFVNFWLTPPSLKDL